jgi:opacity protein-like surface antigen
MKKQFLLLCTSLLCAIASDATAQEGPIHESCCADRNNLYAKVFGGANFLQSTSLSGNDATYNAGYIVAGSLGYSWRYGLRVEGEYAFRRNMIDEITFVTQGYSNSGYFQTSSYMANILWYMPLSLWGCRCEKFRPLVGAGVGYDFQQMSASNSRIIFNQKWYVFSWQAIAGIAYRLFYNTEVSLEYKFHQGNHFYNHAIGVGLAYQYRLK